MADTYNDPFKGVWHYRSFLNDAGNTTPDNLLFGEGMFTFTASPVGTLAGTADFGGGLTMKFRGATALGNPMSLRFQGTGTGTTNKDWVYDYVGWLVPAWPNGVNQVEAIVGSVVRTMPHNHGQAPAGVVVSFYAVRKS